MRTIAGFTEEGVEVLEEEEVMGVCGAQDRVRWRGGMRSTIEFKEEEEVVLEVDGAQVRRGMRTVTGFRGGRGRGG